MKGTLYGIGVGPGDPELMTVKAVRLCREADVIALPHKDPKKCTALQIALGAVPELWSKEAVFVDMPMTKDPAVLEQAHAEAAARVAELLEAGKNVAFLTLGDPTVYSTYFYIHSRIAALGYTTCVVPGVPSFCAAAAALGEPLCMNAQQLHIIPGTYAVTEALDYPGTKVLMKNNVPEVRSALAQKDAFMVENASRPDQQLYRGIENFPEKAGYFTLFIARDPA